jgi:glycosyltransferase involved in cell wall biosynthesis
MRITFLTTHRERCGIATYSEALIGALRQRGALVDVIAPRLPAGEKGDLAVPRLWRRDEATSAEAARVFARLLADRPDVVHLQATLALFSPDFVWTLGQLCRAARLPLLVTLHGRFEADPEAASKLQRLLRALRKGHIKPLVHSRGHVLELQLEGGFGGHEIPVIPHGIGEVIPGDPARSRAALGLPAGAPVIAHFGFLLPDKGVDDVMLAMAALKAKLPDLRYLVVGSVYGVRASQEYFDRLHRLREGLGLGDRVQIKGEFLPDDQARQELQAADWVVLNYRTGMSQGASGAARFALTAGRPLALSAAPIFDDLRVAATTLYEPLSQSLEELLVDPDLARTATDRGRRHAAEQSWSEVARQHLDLYRSLQRR